MQTTLFRSRLIQLGFVAVAAGLALSTACGGSHYNSTGPSSPPYGTASYMNVHVVDAPSQQFKQINLNIQKVEIHSDATGWITLSTPNKTVNLLSLTGGVAETLAAGAMIPVGHYEQMRLMLGAGNTVVLQDGTSGALTVPSGIQSGVKIPGDFTVAAGTTADVFIDFDGAHSIQVVMAGASQKFILRPTIRAIDKTVTGSISGILTASAGGAGLSAALVSAETVDASGHAAIVRTVASDSTGAFTLDLLPLGQTYFVVSQPFSKGTYYDAQASGPLALSATSPTLTFNAAFTQDLSISNVGGTLTPTASDAQSDTVFLLQSFDAGGGKQNELIVNSTAGIVGTTEETYSFTAPVGLYAVQASRTTLNADGTTTLTASAPSAPFQIVSGLISQRVNISF